MGALSRDGELQTWNQIASYLQVSVRTAQLWANHRGLPVHHLTGERTPVFAFKQELDAWQEANQEALPQTARPKSLGETESEEAAVTVRPPSRRRVLAFATAGVGVAGAAAIFFVRQAESPRSARLHGRVLDAFDIKGNLLWRFELGGELVADYGDSILHQHIALADLEGTGRNSIVALARYVGSPAGRIEDELICLDWRGRLRWRFRPNPPLLDFEGTPFARAWHIHEFLVQAGGRVPTIWCAVHHGFRFASCLLRISPNGNQTVQFWPRGFIEAICTFERGGRPMLALGGIDNSVNLPFLSIFEADGRPLCAPLGRMDDRRYSYANEPPEVAREFILLPNMETNRLYLDDYWNFKSVEYREPVLLAHSAQGAGGAAQLYRFEFSDQLRPIAIRANHNYKFIHDEMQNRGIVDHPYLKCPERIAGLPIRRWSGEGWLVESIPFVE